jgi:hypothetical protein
MCARLYRAQDKLVFEGSYEITPMFQADINALRRISPRFVVLLIVTTGYVWFMRAPLSGSPYDSYPMLLGVMFLLEATVHARHFRNWFQFKYVVPGMKGRLEYPRAAMLMASAWELFLFACLYGGPWVVTVHPFLLGGTLSNGFAAFGHYRLAKRHAAAAVGKTASLASASAGD